VNKYARYDATEKGRERKRRYDEKHRALINSKRVFGASGYLGTAPRPEQAAQLNRMGREFRARQNQSRA